MPSPSELKKRPPPIQVPPPPPPRLTPGPNAFAIAAAKAKQEELAKQAGGTPESDVPRIPSPLRRQPRNSEDLRKDYSAEDARASSKTTFSQLMDAARGSPQKPASRASPQKSTSRTSTDSRHTKSSGKSGRSQRSHRTAGDAIQEAYEAGKKGASTSAEERRQILPWEEEAAIMRDSVRARIEDKADNKASKIMGQSGHIRQDSNGKNHKTVLAGRYTDVSLLANKAPEPVKSPKKKIFGMSIPRPSGINLNFGRSAQPTPAPENMPAKAAEVLGAGMDRPLMGRRNTPSQPWRPAPRPPRTTAKSLPAKGKDPTHADQWGRRHDSLPSHRRTPHRKSRSPVKEHLEVPVLKLKAEASFDFGTPPTPPRKDTPKEAKVQALGGNNEVQDAACGEPLSPTPSKCAQQTDDSPAKRDAQAAKYAKLVDAPAITSACAEIENSAFELEGDSMHPGFDVKDGELQKKYPEWQSNEQQRAFTDNNGGILMLLPRFYSPSLFSAKFEDGRPSHNTDKNRLLFRVPALPNANSYHSVKSSSTVDIVFQGSPSEIDFCGSTSSNSNEIMGAMVNEAQNVASPSDNAGWARAPPGPDPHAGIQSNPPAGSSAHQQTPPDTSSRLTEMLDGVRISPSKSSDPRDPAWRESAAVQPLMVPNGRGQMITSPPTSAARLNLPETCLGVLSDGSHILRHIDELHRHIDVPGQTLYDRCELGREATFETAKEVKAKLDELMAMLEKRFDLTKTELLTTIKTTSGRVVDQNNAIHAELEKLYDYIKSDVADVLAKQSKKTADLENIVKTLQTTVHDLQKAVDKQTQAQSQYVPNYANSSKNMYSSPLPTHHSQPNFGYDTAAANNDVGRDMGHRAMPPIADSSSNGRYAYNGYGNGNNGSHGQAWYGQGRPATAGRDATIKDENTAYVPGPNGYYNPAPLQARSGNAGSGYMANSGYNSGGYYGGGPSEGNYSYGQSGK